MTAEELIRDIFSQLLEKGYAEVKPERGRTVKQTRERVRRLATVRGCAWRLNNGNGVVRVSVKG